MTDGGRAASAASLEQHASGRRVVTEHDELAQALDRPVERLALEPVRHDAHHRVAGLGVEVLRRTDQRLDHVLARAQAGESGSRRPRAGRSPQSRIMRSASS